MEKEYGVRIEIEGSWNGSYDIEMIWESAVKYDKDIEASSDGKPYRKGSDEAIEFNFVSKKEAQEFDNYIQGAVCDTRNVDIRDWYSDECKCFYYIMEVLEDDSPYEEGDYIADGMHYNR